MGTLIPLKNKNGFRVDKECYRGKEYPVRTLMLDEDMPFVVGTHTLCDVLTDDMGVPVSKEAEMVDDRINFYVTEEEFCMSDDDLIKLIDYEIGILGGK